MTEETKIARPEMDHNGLLGQLCGATAARGHGPVYVEGAMFALMCLRQWGLIDEAEVEPSNPAAFPRMTRSEIIEALRTAAEFFNRPGDLRFETAEVSSYGVVSYAHIVGQGVAVLRDGGLSFRFTTGLDALDSLIASLLMRADQISSLMLIAHAARTDESATSPMEVEEALTRLKWRFGGAAPAPSITPIEEDSGEKIVLRLASRLWVKMGHHRHCGPFQLAKGSPVYDDCVEMAREALL